jgi:hypothetical protein
LTQLAHPLHLLLLAQVRQRPRYFFLLIHRFHYQDTHTHTQAPLLAHMTYGVRHPSCNGGEIHASNSSLGPPAEEYTGYLAREGLRTDCRESFALGLHPLVALISSDCRDRSQLMIEEYTSSLQKFAREACYGTLCDGDAQTSSSGSGFILTLGTDDY